MSDMNENANCQSVSADINQAPATQSTTLCVSIRKRKLIWMIVTTISIVSIIIIPTTIIFMKKVNLTITTTITASATSAIIITATTRTNKCIFTGQMNFFISIDTSKPNTIADVNGDNKFDIIIADYFGHNVRIFLNTGTGIFNHQANYFIGDSSGPSSITTADLDNDNKLDIIVTIQSKSTIGVFFNRGNGTFNDPVIYSTGSSSGPMSVTTADIDGNKTPDIILVNNDKNTVGVFLNKGNGTFIDQVTYSTGFNSQPEYVTTADIDGDKTPDIIVANSNGNTVSVFLNKGNGTFNGQVIYPTGNGSCPIRVKVADIDGDNKPDIVVVNLLKKNIGVFLNKGNGTFNDQVIYPSGIRSGGPICFTKRDIDGNNVLDSLFAVSDAAGVRLS